MADRVRRRDRAIAGPSRSSRSTLIVVVAIAVFVLVVGWLLVQTLGSQASKQGAAASSRML
jgi:hypothetical protein